MLPANQKMYRRVGTAWPGAFDTSKAAKSSCPKVTFDSEA